MNAASTGSNSITIATTVGERYFNAATYPAVPAIVPARFDSSVVIMLQGQSVNRKGSKGIERRVETEPSAHARAPNTLMNNCKPICSRVNHPRTPTAGSNGRENDMSSKIIAAASDIGRLTTMDSHM
jgi:hypothetical protein